MHPPPPLSEDARLRSELARHKAGALACLGLAALGWGISHTGLIPADWAGFMRAVCEAGMVGGLADWFAVTALFRRPMGLPIPHTALIPRNQGRIADGIARYIDREFLQPDTLVDQMRRMDVAGRLSALLHVPENQDRVTALIANMLPGLVRGGDEAAIRTTLLKALKDAFQTVDLRKLAARLLRVIVETGALEPLIRDVADRIIGSLMDRQDWILDVVEQKSRWWVPRAVDRRLADELTRAAAHTLWDLRDPHSPMGAELRAVLRELPDAIEAGHPLGERVATLVRNLLDDPAAAPIVAQATATLRRAAAEDMAAPDSRIRSLIGQVVQSVAAQLEDGDLRAKVNENLEHAFVRAMPSWRERIMSFISTTLRAQDVREFVRRVELRVGRDLQYIRINGTLLGAAIGGCLYGLNTALGG